MTVEYLLVGAGILLVLAGVFGGGFEIQQIKVPRMGGTLRFFACFVGMCFVTVAVFSHWQNKKVAELDDALGIMPGSQPQADVPVEGVQRKSEEYDSGKEYYRVCYVEHDDPDGLNVRLRPGVAIAGEPIEKTGSIPYNARKIRYLKERALVGNWYWYKVRYRSPSSQTSGWVNTKYLCPDDGECDCRP